MLELNSEEIEKFKQQISSLTVSMVKLSEHSVVNLKVSLPSDKVFSRLGTLKSAIESIDTSSIQNLNNAFRSFSDVKYSGVSSLLRDFNSLSSINVSAAIGNLRDVQSAYSKFNDVVNNNKKPTDKKTDQNNAPKDITPLESLSKFIRVSGKSDTGQLNRTINALKRVSEIKVDPETAEFFDNVSNVVSRKFDFNNNSNPRDRKTNWSDLFGSKKDSVDIASAVSTALALLGSGVFLKRQANIAREVTDLLSVSEITGLDSFSNRAGIAALGVNPTAVADQQRQASRELLGARLFGELDPKRLILHNMLGTNFQSSQQEILAKSLKLSPKLADYILSQLFGDEFAKASSRLRNAYKGANKEQIKSINSIVFTKFPEIDVGSYTRFMFHFEAFFSLSKVLFQKILGSSIKVLESSFEKINASLLKLIKNDKAISSVGRIISAFVSSFTSVFGYVADGLVSIGKYVVENDLEKYFVKAASVLGVLVAGNLILKVIGLTTSLLTSLIGFGKIKNLAMLASQTLGGIFLPTGNSNGKNNPPNLPPTSAKTPSLLGTLAKGSSGFLTVVLAQQTISALGDLWNVTPDGKEKGDFYKEKLAKGLMTSGLGIGTVAAGAAATGVGIPAALIAGALGTLSYGTGYALQNSDDIINVLNKIVVAISESQLKPYERDKPVNVINIQQKGSINREIIKNLNYNKNQ